MSASRSYPTCDYGPLDRPHTAYWEAFDLTFAEARSCDEHLAKMKEEFPPEEGYSVRPIVADLKGNKDAS